ncbi:MAG: PglZ domain-containing protein [Bacteroidetes bacterium]|nr:MAG: PglZ domain-containing protein [Bacteroidota bacterium]
MHSTLIEHIAQDLKDQPSKFLLIENPDRFFQRKDIQVLLESQGIIFLSGSSLYLRVSLETQDEKNEDATVCYFISNENHVLEDIREKVFKKKLSINDYLKSYHSSSLISEDITILEELHKKPQLRNLSQIETAKVIEEIRTVSRTVNSKQVNALIEEIGTILNQPNSENKWFEIVRKLSVLLTLEMPLEELNTLIDIEKEINSPFQDYLKQSYSSLHSSNYFKSPKIVSKILPFIANQKIEKQALVVIDGMAYWQYEMLKKELDNSLISNDGSTYAWIPSITQLSRQAIFRGANPDSGYKQNPTNEERLFKAFWMKEGISEEMIGYTHGIPESLNYSLSKQAIVITDLDDQMHGASDLGMLRVTTNYLFEKKSIITLINDLTDNGYTVYLTADHGNIQAKGYGALKEREKLGTNQSGSRSERHLEYSKPELAQYFLESNPELNGQVVNDGHVIYMSSDLAFSRDKSTVTHGGSHILEVIIPFIELKK